MVLPKVSFLPELIEKVFQKYEQQAEEHSAADKWEAFQEDFQKQCCAELVVIFGELLTRTLRLLDSRIAITVYSNVEETRHIAEITIGRNSTQVTRLFPDINYCKCDYFLQRVLRLNLPASSTSADTTDCSYTCEHVLALRLAKLWRVRYLRYETLESDQLNFLLGQMHASQECDSDCSDSI